MREHSSRKKAASRSEADLLQRPRAPEGAVRRQVSRFARDFSGVPLQAKLKVGAPGDSFEREADRIAEEVMRTPEPRIQRKCGCGGSCGDCSKSDDEEGLLRRASRSGAVEGAAAPEHVDAILRTPGAPLDAATRGFMEDRFGQDFARVRVHSGAAGAEAAGSVDARAFTVGSHVVFGAGEYQPHTSEGRRLLAHELAHVSQQTGGVSERVQRDDPPAKPKKPKPGSGAAAAKLDFRKAKNAPIGGCLVFMHHDESNAHKIANLMHEHCRYNLAIVKDHTPGERRVKLGRGTIDPNELFPKNVAEDCWRSDQPCIDFIKAHEDETKKDIVEQVMQRQFFLEIKHCSEDFSLPVIGLHNNAVGDTKRYRDALKARAKTLEAEAKKAAAAKAAGKPAPATKPVAPDIEEIRGKTFVSDGNIPAGAKAFKDLEEWLLKNMAGVVKRDPAVPDSIKHKKPTVKTPSTEKTADGRDKPELLTPKQTNIFLWCSGDDNTRCQVGDPERPDNVVWVTNRNDFGKLAGKKVNVVLQTEDTDTDLSTLFIKLPKIGQELKQLGEKLEKELPIDKAAAEKNLQDLNQLFDAKGMFSPDVWKQGVDTARSAANILRKMLVIADAKSAKVLKADDLHFVNIETPQGGGADAQLEAFQDVKMTLGALGFDFCDVKNATTGKMSEESINEAIKPPKPAKAAKPAKRN